MDFQYESIFTLFTWLADTIFLSPQISNNSLLPRCNTPQNPVIAQPKIPSNQQPAKTRAFSRHNYRARMQQQFKRRPAGGHSPHFLREFPLVSPSPLPILLFQQTSLTPDSLAHSRAQQPSSFWHLSWWWWWWKPNSIVRYAWQPINTPYPGKGETKVPLSARPSSSVDRSVQRYIANQFLRLRFMGNFNTQESTLLAFTLRETIVEF